MINTPTYFKKRLFIVHWFGIDLELLELSNQFTINVTITSYMEN